MADAQRITCRTCDALYKVTKIESPPSPGEHQMACKDCGAPLRPREGRYRLKYALVSRLVR